MSKVTIDKAYYLKLLSSTEILDRLYAGGVDNWEWYGDSLENHTNAIDCDDTGDNIVWRIDE